MPEPKEWEAIYYQMIKDPPKLTDQEKELIDLMLEVIITKPKSTILELN